MLWQIEYELNFLGVTEHENNAYAEILYLVFATQMTHTHWYRLFHTSIKTYSFFNPY